MAKIKIHSEIKNISTNQEETLECMGILDKNKIIYKDNDGINEMNIKENEIVLIKKRNDKTTLTFHFKKGTSSMVDITLEENHFKLPLLTKEIVKKKNLIKIIYQIDSNETFSFTFQYEC